jgi:hypothetical protein
LLFLLQQATKMLSVAIYSLIGNMFQLNSMFASRNLRQQLVASSVKIGTPVLNQGANTLTRPNPWPGTIKIPRIFRLEGVQGELVPPGVFFWLLFLHEQEK